MSKKPGLCKGVEMQMQIVRIAQVLILFAMSCLCIATNTNADTIQESEQEGMVADEVLELAEDIGRWLANNAIQTETGTAWPDNTLSPETISYDLGSGVAGKVLYFVALYRATGNAEYLETAQSGADYLIGVLQDPSSFEQNPRRASLYTGISGIGVALLHVQRHASNVKYERAITQIVDQLREWSVEDAGGLRWSDDFNDLIYGDAGTTLFLSYVAEQTADEEALDLATRGARFLLSQAQDAAAGSFWYFRRSKPFNLPNFSHGTAGIAYVLATTGTIADDESLRSGAKDGFEYIRSISEIEDGLLRIPYGWGADTWAGLYEFGWAHGLSGTALFFARMQKAGIDAGVAAEFASLSRHTILNINLPGAPAEPFAEPSTPLDKRFGRAGVLSLLSQWSAHETAAEDVVILRDSIWAHIRNAAIRQNQTAHWLVDAPEFMGGGRAAYTGIFHGAAGIGLAILHLHSSISGKRPYVTLPDDPFTWPEETSTGTAIKSVFDPR